MRPAKLVCLVLVVGSSLSGQLQFFNPQSRWSSFPPAITTDSAGNTYVVSNTADAATGLTATKLDPSQRVVYSFSFAPVQYVTALSAAVDSHGSLVIGGSTNSSNFPLINALLYPRLPAPAFGQRGFLVKLDPGGTKVQFSTLVGGNELDYHYASWVTEVAVDSSDHIYAAGATSSPTFPVSANAYQKTGGGPVGASTSAFLMKVSNAGDALLYSTYLGGTVPACAGCQATVVAHALLVDGQGFATLTGSASATDFPVTPGAYQCQCAANASNVFVSRFNADASALRWSTILPGSLEDDGSGFGWSFNGSQRVLSLSQDLQGAVTVAGTTLNKAFPTTPGAIQSAYRVVGIPGNSSVRRTGFVAILSNDGAALLHSTYFGGTGASTLRGLVQDPNGNFWITGEVTSADEPVPAGSLILGTGYMAQLDPTLTHVLRYYGLPNGSAGQTFTQLPNGNLVLSGGSNSVVTIPGNAPLQPAVWGVAGSAEPAATPHIAAGELLSIYGVQLGPVQAASGALDSTGKLATAIGGYRVLVNGIPAPLLYAGPNQINLVVPFAIRLDQTAVLQVVTPAGPLPAVSGFSVEPSEPQIFNVVMNQDGSINSAANPAPRDSIVTIWTTGGGALDGAELDGQIGQAPLGHLLLPVSIGLGRLSQQDYGTVTYAGTAPGMVAGVAQINFRIPAAHSGYGTCHLQCPVILGIGAGGGSGRKTSLQPDPILWVVD